MGKVKGSVFVRAEGWDDVMRVCAIGSGSSASCCPGLPCRNAVGADLDMRPARLMALVDRLERDLAELRSELVATELAAMLPDQEAAAVLREPCEEPDEVQVIAVGRDDVARDTQIHRDWEFALSLQETPDLDELHGQKVKRPRQGSVRRAVQAWESKAGPSMTSAEGPTSPADVDATGDPEGDAPVATDSKEEEEPADGHALQCAHACAEDAEGGGGSTEEPDMPVEEGAQGSGQVPCLDLPAQEGAGVCREAPTEAKGSKKQRQKQKKAAKAAQGSLLPDAQRDGSMR